MANILFTWELGGGSGHVSPYIDLINRDVSVGAPATQYWTQLSSSVAGGLAFATILTLLLTPSLLMIQANMSDWLARRRERQTGRTAAAH